jgi:cytochrome oxidase Cu insertion factor (SCO1/SenC/PrrC family)
VPAATEPDSIPASNRRQRLKLLALFALFASPVVASYLAYYVFPPAGRTNYGDLIQPQRPAPALALSRPDGAADRFDRLLGQWVLVSVDAGACDAACAAKLYAMRQQRTMTGKERERLDRVWLVTDAAAPAPAQLREYEGTIVLRADVAQLAAWLPVAPGRRMEDYLYLVDPLGNLMMRFPADGDPQRIRKDLSRLLKASRIG